VSSVASDVEARAKVEALFTETRNTDGVEIVSTGRSKVSVGDGRTEGLDCEICVSGVSSCSNGVPVDSRITDCVETVTKRSTGVSVKYGVGEIAVLDCKLWIKGDR
jgi:hypothetical protein